MSTMQNFPITLCEPQPALVCGLFPPHSSYAASVNIQSRPSISWLAKMYNSDQPLTMDMPVMVVGRIESTLLIQPIDD